MNARENKRTLIIQTASSSNSLTFDLSSVFNFQQHFRLGNDVRVTAWTVRVSGVRRTNAFVRIYKRYTVVIFMYKGSAEVH